MEHKGRDKDHDDHSEEYDRRDNADGLEHLMMEGREKGGGKDGEQLDVIATHKLTYQFQLLAELFRFARRILRTSSRGGEEIQTYPNQESRSYKGNYGP